MQRFLYFFLGCIALVSAQEEKINVENLPLKIILSEPLFDKKSISSTFKRIKIAQTHWYKYNRIRLHSSELYFSNWKAGGETSVSALIDGFFRRRYSNESFFWDNELHISYGMNFQQEQQLKKTDDEVEFTTSVGYRKGALPNIYYSLKASINTQISNGYAYPDKDTPISKPFSPGYLTLGLGIDYAPQRLKLKLFASPISAKATIVADQYLADLGSFGVKAAQYDANGVLTEKGKNYNIEVGFQVAGNWQMPLWENIEMTHRLNLYGDYLRNIGNIDIDWEASLDMKINNYIQARVGIHLKYDDDIKFYKAIDSLGKPYQYGARVQLKQLLSLGLTYIIK